MRLSGYGPTLVKEVNCQVGMSEETEVLLTWHCLEREKEMCLSLGIRFSTHVKFMVR